MIANSLTKALSRQEHRLGRAELRIDFSDSVLITILVYFNGRAIKCASEPSEAEMWIVKHITYIASFHNLSIISYVNPRALFFLSFAELIQ